MPQVVLDGHVVHAIAQGNAWLACDGLVGTRRHCASTTAMSLISAPSKANAQVAGFLFNRPRNGNVTAQIFWLKTRARWRETPVELQHSGSIGRKDLAEYSDAELVILSASVDVSGTLASPQAPPTPTVRGFLELVANGKAKRKE